MLLTKPIEKIRNTIHLPASKSESNRVLIIEALAQWQAKQNKTQLPVYQIDNLSEARDTKILQDLLKSSNFRLNAQDAGTTMRFMVAFCVATHRKAILEGSERMHQRPIGVLVEALQKIGAEITFLGEKGFPPIEIKGFEQKANHVSVRGDVSSQFISALLMIAPTLPKGLHLSLQNKISSQPYIQMTLSLMKYFGVESKWQENEISIIPQIYQMKNYAIEADWSAASYWYSVAALAQEAEINLPHLKANSLQGDSQIAQIMEFFGVKTFYENNGIKIVKVGEPIKDFWEYDFTHQPDLVQTMVALCVGKNIRLVAKGVESLRIKETDRLQALQNEVRKFGFHFYEIESNVWKLEKQEAFNCSSKPIFIQTYSDHRMAMAFAPLSYLCEIEIENPQVVEKSYPNFWQEWKKLSRN
ncbi:MAG: 3-phosphoshikimate 1-carboxyvinyltransferase [Raineya sp.]|nr:3-phosphoshikimate 1-carboxyvinyltransferase [Raineya sp.]